MLDYYQILKRELEEKEPQKEALKDASEKKTKDVSGGQTSLLPFKINKSPAKKGRGVKKPKQELIWLSLSEAAKIGGIQPKTLRRAVWAAKIKYKIVNNRYFRDKKLTNKFKKSGIGRYVGMWKNIKF
jgi:hypothetical protein